MGWAFPTTAQHTNQRRPPDNLDLPNRPFDSIFAHSAVARAGQQQHHEFVVFDRNQVSQPRGFARARWDADGRER
eukprot:818933-Rhodomonas_salina.4